MAVLPPFQNRGVRSAMVRRGLDATRKPGHGAVILVGHPKYYPRLGFVQAWPLGILPPFEVPDGAFLLLGLRKGALQGFRGTVQYPPEFSHV